MKKETKVLSVFPACGKTWVYEHQDELGISVLDSDSSNFSWIERKRTAEELETEKSLWESKPHLLSGKGYINNIKDDLIKVRNPEFPTNYINHIKEQLESGKYDYIFVSSHESVRKALNDANINFSIVCPDITLKEEWVGRCFLRELEGKNKFPIEMLAGNWKFWIHQLYAEAKDNNHEVIILNHGEYLSDVFKNNFI